MNLIWIFVVIGMISFEEVNSVMHWKAKPKISRARLRPLRQSNHAHHPPSSYRHHPIHRAHKPHPPPQPPGYHRHRMPHHHVPIKSYQPPTSLQYSPRQQQTAHSHSHSHVIKHPHPQLFSGPQTRFKQDEYFKNPSFTFSHAAAGSTPNVAHTTPKFVSSSSDNQQHGYMASNYKGWRPIVKPYHSSYTHGAKYHGKDAYHNMYSPKNAGNADSYQAYTNLNMNTLFRDNLKHVKPHKSVKLTPEYSENRGVVIPMPSEVGSNIRLPSSFFMDNSWNQFYNPTVLTSQSEESPVMIRKPFPKFTARLKTVKFNTTRSTEGPPPTTLPPNIQNEDVNGDDSGRLPPSVPKYKITKPKLRTPIQPIKPEYNNEQEMDSIRQLSMPKLTDSGELPPPVSQTPLNLKAKLSRTRTRVRTKQIRPDAFVNTDEVSQTFDFHPAQSPVTSKLPGGRKSHKKEHSPNPLTDENSRMPFPHTAPSNSPTESEESGVRGGNNSSQLEPFPPFPTGFPMSMPPPDFFRNSVSEMEDNNKDGRYGQGPSAPQTSNSIRDSQSAVSDGPKYNNGGDGGREGDNRPPPQQRQHHRHREGGGRRRHKNPNSNQNQGPKENVADSPPLPVQQPYTDNPAYDSPVTDFYFPPGFGQDSSSVSKMPMSFMTMPGEEKPQVIHHMPQQRQPSPSQQQQQQLYPINVIRSPEYHKQQSKPLHNIHAGPSHPPRNIHTGPSHAPHNIHTGPSHTPHNIHTGPSHTPHSIRAGPPHASHNQNLHPLDSPGFNGPYQQHSPNNIRGPNQNENYIRNNRQQYVILNIQNGKEQEIGNPTNRPTGIDPGFPNHTPFHHTPQFSFNSPQPFPHTSSSLYPSGQHVPFTTPNHPFFGHQGPSGAPTTLRSQFSNNDQGFINSFPTAPTLRYEAYEATNGYQRQPNNPYQSASNHGVTQLRQQLQRPPRPFNGPPQQQKQQEVNRQQIRQESRQVVSPAPPSYTERYKSNNPADMFVNDEFANIPMEFLDQLRPILLGEDVMANSPIPATVTPTTTWQHVHQSPDIHPPSSFFDNFFQPFDENYRTEATTEQELNNNVPLSTPSHFPGKTHVRAGGGQRGSVNRNVGYDSYKSPSIKQYQVVRPNANRSEPWPTAPTPIISFSPLQEFSSSMSTVSPIHDIDFYGGQSNSPISWSKLRFGELSSTESFLPPTLSSQYRKPLTAFNHTKVGDKKNSFMSYNGQLLQQQHKRPIYDSAPVTTYKPSFGNLKEMDANGLRGAENFPSVALQTTTEPSPLPMDEDLVGDDSNTPRSVRARTTTESYDSQVTTESPEGIQSTSTHKSRRHFRKRKPELSERRKYFSSRVKQSIDLESEKSDDLPVTTHRPGGRTRSTSKTDSGNYQDGNEEFEASRASVLRRRKLFQRRKNFLASRTRAGSEEEDQQQPPAPVKSTTPSSSEPEAVTYGESQWFKLKQPESSEDSLQPSSSKDDVATTEKVQIPRQSSPQETSAATNSFSNMLRPQDIQLVPLITSSEALAEAELASTKPY